MKIKIKLHPGSSQEKIIRISKEEYEVWLKERPLNGKANKSLEKFLKNYLGLKVKLISGFNSRLKFFELKD